MSKQNRVGNANVLIGDSWQLRRQARPGPSWEVINGRPGIAPGLAAQLDWQAGGSCTQSDPDAWFPESYDRKAARLAVVQCRSCPVLEECYDWARRTKPAHGIVAGTTPRERRTLFGPLT